MNSIIEQTLNNLQRPIDDQILKLRQIPWHALLLVKWACQDKMVGQQAQHDATEQNLIKLRNDIWRLPEQLNNRDDTSQPVRLMMRQLLHVQADFQRHSGCGFIREAALIASCSSSHSLYKLFINKTGLTPEEYIDFTFATHTSILQGKQNINYSAFYKPLLQIHSENALESYIDLISKDLDGLVGYFRELPDANKKVVSETFEFPIIARYPFYKSAGTIRCWSPVVFERGSCGMVHSILSEEGSVYIERFSKVFEQHCVGLASRVHGEFYNDNDLKRHLPPNTKNPDALVSFPNANVFIEIKSGIYGQATMTVGHNEIFAQKTRALRTAVVQAWTASDALRVAGTAPRHILNAKSEFLLIVTNKELSAGCGEDLASIYPEGTLSAFTQTSITRLPLANIYVISVDDYERLMVAANKKELVLSEFLQSCRDDDSIPANKKFFMEQHLTHYDVSFGFSDLVVNAMDESINRIKQAFPDETFDDITPT